MSPIEKNYTPAQVAEMLQVNEVSVRRWLAAGKMSGFKLGRAWRVTESDLQTFIDERDEPMGVKAIAGLYYTFIRSATPQRSKQLLLMRLRLLNERWQRKTLTNNQCRSTQACLFGGSGIYFELDRTTCSQGWPLLFKIFLRNISKLLPFAGLVVADAHIR